MRLRLFLPYKARFYSIKIRVSKIQNLDYNQNSRNTKKSDFGFFFKKHPVHSSPSQKYLYFCDDLLQGVEDNRKSKDNFSTKD